MVVRSTPESNFKPGGKREQNRRRRRALIVELATQYFLERGYAATSMSAISEEIGGSKATMWSYFPSKVELFTAVVDAQIAAFSSIIIDDGSATQRFSVGGLRRYCLSFLRALLDPNAIALFRLIVREEGRFPELNTIFYVRGPAEALHRLTEYLATVSTRDEAARLAILINASLWGWRSHVLTRSLPVSDEEIAGFVETLISRLRLPAP